MHFSFAALFALAAIGAPMQARTIPISSMKAFLTPTALSVAHGETGIHRTHSGVRENRSGTLHKRESTKFDAYESELYYPFSWILLRPDIQMQTSGESMCNLIQAVSITRLFSRIALTFICSVGLPYVFALGNGIS